MGTKYTSRKEKGETPFRQKKYRDSFSSCALYDEISSGPQGTEMSKNLTM
jgi:hypothetical protein